MSNNNSSFVNKEIHLYDYLKEECRHTLIRSHFAGWAFFPFTNPGGGGEGGTWVNFCWVHVCAADLSEPLPQYSLFCGQT